MNHAHRDVETDRWKVKSETPVREVAREVGQDLRSQSDIRLRKARKNREKPAKTMA